MKWLDKAGGVVVSYGKGATDVARGSMLCILMSGVNGSFMQRGGVGDGGNGWRRVGAGGAMGRA